MTRSTGQRRHHFKNTKPSDPAVKRLSEWLSANRTFYTTFRRWLRDGGYSDSTLNIYGCAVRLALGWLDKPYWEIDPQADIARVRAYISERYDSASTRRDYGQGLRKLTEYLYLKCRRSPPEPQINWETYIGLLPEWLGDDVRAYIAHRRRTWRPEVQHRSTISCLSQLTRSLRHMAAHSSLPDAEAITPARWFDYVDDCLADGLSPITLNIRQYLLQDLLSFLSEEGRPICQRTLRVPPLDRGDHLPRDVPPDQVRLLWQEIEADAASPHANTRRMGIMDRAWFLLMLYSGLRSGEIRKLRHDDLDLNERRVRIEQSKGLKDRVVLLAGVTIEALHAYLEVRGQAMTDHVFTYRHRPLSFSYCRIRLGTYGRRCGVQVKPHQLRHSCATLLLNAGAPILAIQRLLGHKDIDTTLIYTRLYDSTVAAHYYRAVGEIESRSDLGGDASGQPLGSGELLALLDSLHVGTLNDAQRETVQTLRMAILALDIDSMSGDENMIGR
jgi:site-specific recombinase XerD